MFASIMNLGNLAFSLNHVSSPNSEKDKLMNIIYSVNSIIVFILYLLAYCKEKKYLLWHAYSLVVLRNTVRIFDIEESHVNMKNYEWIYKLFFNASIVLFMYFIGIMTFIRKKFILLWAVTYFVIYVSSTIIGISYLKTD